MACLEVQRGGRVEGNGSPLPCLDVFKISKEEWNNQSFPLFGCFKNQDREERELLKQTNLPYLKMDLQYWFIINLEKVNWEIYLVNNLSTLLFLQISPIWEN